MQQRNLPHIYPEGATFFITFCLHNAIPKKVSSEIKDKYDLLSYCVMSNHVHLLFCTADYEKIDFLLSL